MRSSIGVWGRTLGVLLLVGSPALAQGLLEEVPAPGRDEGRFQRHVLRTRYVKVRADRLGQPELELNLFPDISLKARGQARRAASGDVRWSGEAPGRSDTRVTLVSRGDVTAATIVVGERMFFLEPVEGGAHALREVTPSEADPEAPPIPVEDGCSGGSADALGSGSGDAGAVAPADGPVIDLLVVYTPATRAAYGATGILAKIDLAVLETNQAYANSGVNASVRLVHSAETNYVEVDSGTDLTRLRGNGDGYMDEVHALRDQYGADVVILLCELADACGRGYLMTSVSSSFAANAFSVVRTSCATGYYSFGHELGHNMGCHHDRANAGGSGAYPYSYGFQNHTGRFRTIMAYQCADGCPRVQHFSNPAVSINGFPTGVDYAVDPANSADNARTLNNTAPTVAAFRTAPQAPGAPAAPTAALSPSLQSGRPGETRSFTLSLTNRDGAGLPASTFALTAVLPSGWVGTVTPGSLTLAPGASGSAQLTVTAPVGAADGDAPLGVDVRDAAQALHAASPRAAFRVDGTPPTVPMGVTASSSKRRVTVSWSPSSDASGVASYVVYRDGNPIGQTSGTSFNDSAVTSGVTYVYQVLAVDVPGNSSGLSQGASVTYGSGGGGGGKGGGKPRRR